VHVVLHLLWAACECTRFKVQTVSLLLLGAIRLAVNIFARTHPLF